MTRSLKTLVFVLLAAAVLGGTAQASPAPDGAATVAKSLSALKAMTRVASQGLPPAVLQEAAGVALIPGARKVDFMVSGREAGGVLLLRGADGSWSNPVLVTLSGGTLGWQVVGDPMDILVVFKKRAAAEAVLKGKLMLGGQASVEPGPLGKNLKGATKKELDAELYSYILSGGSFSEAVVGTTTLRPASNDAYYGVQQLRLEDIVSGKLSAPSPEAAQLRKLLAHPAPQK